MDDRERCRLRLSTPGTTHERIPAEESPQAVPGVFCSLVTTRLALHSRLIPGTEEAYEIEHARVWPELIAVMRTAGITDWSIWRSGRDLFHLVECDDFEAAVAQLKQDPVDQRWQQHMSQFVEGFAENPEGVAGQSLRHVWTMSEQTD